MSILSSLRRWYGRRNAGVIDVGEDGFDVHIGSRSHGMYWSDIVRIEAGRSPSLTVEIFYVQLFNTAGQRLKLNDRMQGFKAFEGAMLLHWPGTKQTWTQIFGGPPDQAEHATLWNAPPNAY